MDERRVPMINQKNGHCIQYEYIECVRFATKDRQELMLIRDYQRFLQKWRARR
jgi:hypothetical protein